MTKHTKDSVIAVGVLIGIAAILYLWPIYGVWSAEKSGQAALARANFSKEVEVATSKAHYEAAVWEARTDTARAHGTARANEIIGKSISQNYLQWLWVQNLEKQEKSVIYVPSVNGIPTMPLQEATRLQPPVIIQQQP